MKTDRNLEETEPAEIYKLEKIFSGKEGTNMTIEEKFAKLGVDNAPGQEERQKAAVLDLRGEKLEGREVDFSHGDVDAFEPIPGSLETFEEGYRVGGKQAYTLTGAGPAVLRIWPGSFRPIRRCPSIRIRI